MVVNYKLAMTVTAAMILFRSESATAQITFERRALSGDVAPGGESGESLHHQFGRPSINNWGQAVFDTAFTKNFSTTGSGVWAGTSSSTKLIVRSRTEAPFEEDGFVFDRAAEPVIDERGQVKFASTVFNRTTGENYFSVWSSRNEDLSLVARTGSEAPGIGNNVSLLFGNPANIASNRLTFNDSGQVAFRSHLSGPEIVPGTDSSALWLQNNDGSLGLVARQGSAASGTEANVAFGLQSPLRSVSGFNNAGQVAFTSELVGPTVDSTNDTGTWIGNSNDVRLIAREGERVPNTESELYFDRTTELVLNSSGKVGFETFLSGPGVSTSNLSAIFSEENGVLNLVARQGDAAPGTELFFGAPSSLQLNDAGDFAFVAALKDQQNRFVATQSVWSERSGSLDLIFKGGDTAPVSGSEVTFDGSSFSATGLALNNNGQAAFISELSGTEVDSTNDRALFATDQNGALALVAREGDLFDVDLAPDSEDFRTIGSVKVVGTNANIPPYPQSGYFNDLGQIAFALSFTDNSAGIFVANTIPLPTSTNHFFAAGTSLAGEDFGTTNASENSSHPQSPSIARILDSEMLADSTDVTLRFARLENLTNENKILRNAENFELLASDVLQVNGLDGVMHVIDLSFDPARGQAAELLWFDEGEPGIEDDAFVNVILGNSNVTGFDFDTDTVVLADGSSGSLELFLADNLFSDMSYEEYLLNVESGHPQLGAYGFDSEASTAWAVIDHNSSFGAAANGLVLGDFDLDGDVDLDDLDQYIGNIGAAATGGLEALDLDADGIVGANDFQRHYEDLVETSNGGKGTFAGDLDLDGTVDVLGDAAILIDNLGNAVNSWANGDANGDGIVDVLGDAALLVNNLGRTNGGSATVPISAVPEPSSLLLLAVAGLGAIARRRHYSTVNGAL